VEAVLRVSDVHGIYFLLVVRLELIVWILHGRQILWIYQFDSSCGA